MLARAALVVLFALPLHAARYSACGVSFAVPSSWQVTRLKPANGRPSPKCSFGIDPRDWQRVQASSDYETAAHAVQIDVYPLALDDVKRIGAFLLSDDGVWRIVARGNDFPKPITTPCCRGLRGALVTGIYFKPGRGPGGYQGLGDGDDYAVITRRKRSVVVQGAEGYTRAFEAILESARP